MATFPLGPPDICLTFVQENTGVEPATSFHEENRQGSVAMRTSYPGLHDYIVRHFGVTPEDYRYRSIYLLIVFQVVFAVFFLVIAALNFILRSGHPDTDRLILIIVEVAIAVGIFFLFLYHHKSLRTSLVSLVTVIVIALFTVYYIYMVGYNFGSIFASLFIPPIALFLLGSRNGAIISVVTGIAAVLAVQFSTAAMDQVTRGNQIMLYNFIGLSIVCVSVLVFYENSRKAAYDALDAKNKELEILSVTDKLTGLFNRMRLDQVLAAEIPRVQRSQGPLSLMILDIDHFKRVNDELGHAVGDEVLRAFAGILCTLSRAIDIVGRWGGEEFLILCPETDEKGALELAERLRRAVDGATFGAAGHRTVSIGVSVFREGDDATSLLVRADEALYYAKEHGRNQVSRGLAEQAGV